MKKIISAVFGFLLLSAIVWGAVFYWQNLRGAWPAVKQSPADIANLIDKANMPLKASPDINISVLTENVPGARAMAIGPRGSLWVSQPEEGKISTVSLNNNKLGETQMVFENLRKPHGLAFDPQDPYLLYVAEEDKISKIRVFSNDSWQKIIDLPVGGRHTTRTISFGPDDRLYVSIGSSCDVCIEEDERRGAIYSLNKTGGDFKKVAGGLRNSVFFTWSYIDGRMWATDMGRDFLGDNLPPDEINIITEGKDYGWPHCYGKQVRDTSFNSSANFDCSQTEGSYIDIPAHSAPLGLAFIPEEGWPEEYWYDLLVAYHGSWNKSEPTGYKIVRMDLDARGNYLEAKDFVSGWLTSDNEALGRPVDMLVQPGGTMYVSDDKAGVIYKLTVGSGAMDDRFGKDDLLKVDNLKPGDVIASPLKITGEARGGWFFEASFPVTLLDGNGNIIAQSFAQAQDEWMTENFVPFESEINFVSPATETGILILQKDNPSGLPEYDDELRIPVKFVQDSQSERAQDGCVIGGCSAQICADEPMMSTCEYKPEYACYKSAVCEKQADGKCGWTTTIQLQECLEANKD